MIDIINPEEFRCGATPPRLSSALPLVELNATRPTRTLAPLPHETTSVPGLRLSPVDQHRRSQSLASVIGTFQWVVCVCGGYSCNRPCVKRA